MEGVRVAILMGALAFGIYASYNAGNTLKGSGSRFSTSRPDVEELLWKDTLFMRKAIALGHHAQSGEEENSFGSIIIKDYRIVGKGWNKCNANLDPSAHAEVEAVRDACQELGSLSLEGCTIYTTAQPCPMCLSLLYAVKIDKIFYGISSSSIPRNNDDLPEKIIYENLMKARHTRLIPEIMLMSEEAALPPHSKYTRGE